MIQNLDSKILSEDNKPSTNEDIYLEITRKILRRKIGTKDQRNAIVRIIKQLGDTDAEREVRVSLRKALTKIASDYKVTI